METPIQYAAYQATDFDFCNTLVEANMASYFETNKVIWDTTRFRKALVEHLSEIILFHSQRAGFLEISFQDTHCYLHALHISDKYRGQGIGSASLTRIHSLARQYHTQAVRLSVYQENPASRLYERLGYKEIGYKDSKRLMELTL